MNINQISQKTYNYNTNNKSQNNYNQNVSFEGHFPNLEKGIAKRMGTLIQKESFEKLFEKINKEPKIANNLFAHLTVLGSTLLSAFYVGKTITNKDLEEDKRKTLAINQGLVWVVSTVCAYTLDNATNDLFGGVVRRFEKLNENTLKKSDIKKLTYGLKCAKSMIAIDLVYRFLAPVLVTPLANHIGNKLKENKAAKLAQTNNQKMDKVA